VTSGIVLTEIRLIKSPRRSGTTKTTLNALSGIMKSTETVINNLKQKIAEKKLQYSDLYTQYTYKMAIKQTIDELYGKEPEYLDLRGIGLSGE
jgi:transcriptional accessory protein Tex/SPT6